MDADATTSRDDATDSRDDVRFEERQTFPSWMGAALAVLAIPPVAATSVLVLATDGATPETITVVAVVVLGVAPLPLVQRAALRTAVRKDGIYFRFRPFHRSYRRVSFAEIEDVRREERRAYSYGLKWTRSGWVYAPDSSEGVRIYHEEGKPVFLGSERPYDLLTAIEEGRRESDRRASARSRGAVRSVVPTRPSG